MTRKGKEDRAALESKYGAASALQKGTPQGTGKSKEQGSRAGKSNHKDAPKDMLYYAQKLSRAQGSGVHEEMEEDGDWGWTQELRQTLHPPRRCSQY